MTVYIQRLYHVGRVVELASVPARLVAGDLVPRTEILLCHDVSETRHVVENFRSCYKGIPTRPPSKRHHVPSANPTHQTPRLGDNPTQHHPRLRQTHTRLVPQPRRLQEATRLPSEGKTMERPAMTPEDSEWKRINDDGS